MKTKEYRLFKTAAKTARENNLLLIEDASDGKKILFDFSLLVDAGIPIKEIEVMTKHTVKYVRPYNKRGFYGKSFDDFTACDGIAEFCPTYIYNAKTGKRLYTILTLCRVEHYHKERKSVYDQYYDVESYHATYRYAEKEVEI